MKLKTHKNKKRYHTINTLRKFMILIVTLSVTISCSEDADDNLVLATADVKDFVWKGMNEFYIYGDDVPDLRNTRFGLNGLDNRYEATEDYLEFLDGFNTPEALFNALIFDQGNSCNFLAKLFQNDEAVDYVGLLLGQVEGHSERAKN